MSDIEGAGAPKTATTDELITFASFLESVPPSQMRAILSIARKKQSGTSFHYVLNEPQLRLHCTHEDCAGLRFFRATSEDIYMKVGEVRTIFLDYVCSNCRVSTKSFSLHVELVNTTGLAGRAYKYGELPAFGPPTPPRVLRLFGSDREIFLKGRRCESQGLGIGAFGYYRRVVESHKNQIFDEIIRVAEKVSAPQEMVETLRNARNEVQFSKPIASAKSAIPQSLLINGHNPLTLLHSALSAGLHDETDERCLELAHDIRVILIELADRLGAALKDEDELNTAVSRLVNAKSTKPKSTT
ncbi:MAG: hypothetical protein EOO16_21745 [Chitinophagaceae bacterium]|nr:MAG: hypothetical protein EOO16_21745 [Chitinophagaceae bacterium]